MEVRVKVLFCCTAQGCPLSPALFVLFIEQLAQAIREYRDTTGIPVRETEYKIFLYADDWPDDPHRPGFEKMGFCYLWTCICVFVFSSELSSVALNALQSYNHAYMMLNCIP